MLPMLHVLFTYFYAILALSLTEILYRSNFTVESDDISNVDFLDITPHRTSFIFSSLFALIVVTDIKIAL